MHVLYDEDGDFKAGTILTEQEASLQVESATGKRTKLKKNQVMLRFAQPTPSELLTRAQQVAADIDLDFLWECAPQDEFDFQALAQEYFGGEAKPAELAGLLIRVHGAPIYFYRKGRGRYRPAPADILKAALAGMEKRRRLAEQQAAWTAAMQAGEVPEPIASQAIRLLVAPDKQTIEYKAVEAAANAMQETPTRMLLRLGAVASPYALHRQRFLHEQFPRGAGFAALSVPSISQELPLAPAAAFSIDDVTTTEIDDAFSVVWRDDGSVRVGIHIAAPSLGIARGDAVDQVARQRLSTVYMPGDKITMLPDALVAAFSLDAGREQPALSLYFELQPQGGPVELAEPSALIPTAFETKVERVAIAANLRHNHLDALATEATLGSAQAALAAAQAEGADQLPFGRELGLLFRLSQALQAERERVRGKPEPKGRADFNFYVDWQDDPCAREHGLGVVRVEQRRRGAPLDMLVAELMILANCHWGGWLAQRKAVGIYRTQSFGRVRMQTSAAPHDGLGVPQYAWCTSPLRRYVDLINQMQLIGAAQSPAAGPVQVPFANNDADLFAIVSSFDAAYSAYADFQGRMERLWCLRWLQQHGVRRVVAVCLKEDLFRLEALPLVVRVPGAPNLARGAKVEIDVVELDEVDVVAHVRFVGVVAQDSAQDGAQDLADIDELDDVQGAADGLQAATADAGQLSAEPVSDDASDDARRSDDEAMAAQAAEQQLRQAESHTDSASASASQGERE